MATPYQYCVPNGKISCEEMIMDAEVRRYREGLDKMSDRLARLKALSIKYRNDSRV
jgi:hypothetical protein